MYKDFCIPWTNALELFEAIQPVCSKVVLLHWHTIACLLSNNVNLANMCKRAACSSPWCAWLHFTISTEKKIFWLTHEPWPERHIPVNSRDATFAANVGMAAELVRNQHKSDASVIGQTTRLGRAVSKFYLPYVNFNLPYLFLSRDRVDNLTRWQGYCCHRLRRSQSLVDQRIAKAWVPSHRQALQQSDLSQNLEITSVDMQ